MKIGAGKRNATIAICRAISVFVLIFTASCRGDGVPRLHMENDVAPDLAALAAENWQHFTDAFAGRLDCFGDVTLQTTDELTGRAAYNPESAAVTVEVPATAAILQEALVHEWAHHVEFQCDAHADMRPAFLDAQGLPSDQDWFSASSWPATPSEQYAEAAIILVLGRRQVPTEITVKQAAVDVLADWAAGERTSQRSKNKDQ